MSALTSLARGGGDDEPGVGLATGPFDLGDHPALAAPAAARCPSEVLKAPRRRAALLAQLSGSGEFGFNLGDEPGVAGEAE